MAYLGRSLTAGNYLSLDDISSQFNGSKTTFNLRSGGQAFYPGSSYSILVTLSGVVQEADSAYQVLNDQIIFAAPPDSSDTFYCLVLGVALGVGVPANGTVDGTKFARPFSYDDGLLYLDDTNDRVGINTTSPTVALDVNGTVKATSFSGDGSLLTGIGIGLTVSTRNGFAGVNSTGDEVSNITAIRFDSNSGFAVTDLGSGEVFVNFGSAFNPWTISGQDQLDATGEEELEIIAGTGIEITTDITSTPKSITFTNTSTSTGYANTAGISTVSQGLTGTPNISVGVITASSLEVSGNVSIAGTLTYEDVTNVDSIGVITARSDVLVGGNLNVTGVSTFNNAVNVNADMTFDGAGNNLRLNDNSVLELGTDNDFNIFHNSSVSIIRDSGTGGLLIDSDNEIKLAKNGTGSDSMAVFTVDGPAELYWDGSKKFETTGSGALVTGILTATTFSGNVTGTAVTATTANITNLTGTLSGVSTNFVSAIGIQSAGTVIGAGITQLNFIGTGNTFAVNGSTVDISISGGGGGSVMVIPTRSGTAVTFSIPSGGDLAVIARSGTINIPV